MFFRTCDGDVKVNIPTVTVGDEEEEEPVLIWVTPGQRDRKSFPLYNHVLKSQKKGQLCNQELTSNLRTSASELLMNS